MKKVVFATILILCTYIYIYIYLLTNKLNSLHDASSYCYVFTEKFLEAHGICAATLQESQNS